MKHLSNIHYPFNKSSKSAFCHSFEAMDAGLEAMNQEWQAHLEWVRQNIVGKPQATEHYTSEQLEQMGMVGIYSNEKPE